MNNHNQPVISSAEADTPYRPMSRGEIHFRFWLWACFTLGGCYVIYALQVATRNTLASPPFLHSQVRHYLFAFFNLFLVISSVALMPEGEATKPLKLRQYLHILWGILVIAGVFLIYLALPSTWTNMLPWTTAQANAFIDSFILNPLTIIVLGVYLLQAHWRKWKSHLSSRASSTLPLTAN